MAYSSDDLNSLKVPVPSSVLPRSQRKVERADSIDSMRLNPPQAMDLKPKMVEQARKKFYGDKRFSDFTVSCHGKEYHVHRVLISTQRRWFEACCTAPFKEAADRSVILHEDDPVGIEKMFEYFYQGAYSPEIPNRRPKLKEKGPNDFVQLHAYVYAIAEKYDCPALRDYALESFRVAIRIGFFWRLETAVLAVYQQVELPESDRTLKTAVLEGWVFSRNDRFAEGASCDTCCEGGRGPQPNRFSGVFPTTDTIVVASHVKAESIAWQRSEPFSSFLSKINFNFNPAHFILQPTINIARVDITRAAPPFTYGDERFSDYTLVCGEKEYKIHRIIISAYSKYFERACSSPFLEASQQKIKLKEDLPEAVKCMIEYFYKLDYDASEGLPDFGDPKEERSPPYVKEPQFAMQRHAYIYAVAEKYELPGLKAVALQKFKKEAAKLDVWRLLRLLWTAKTIYWDILLPENDKELRHTLVDAWLLFAGASMGTSLSNEMTRFMDRYFKVTPGFAADVAIKLMGGFTRDRMWTRCPRCNRRQDTQQYLPTPDDCSACRGGSVPAEDEAVLLSNVTIKKFW